MSAARVARACALALFLASSCSSLQAAPVKAPADLQQAFSAARTVRLEGKHNATAAGPLRAAAVQVLEGLGYVVQDPAAGAADATLVLDIWCDLEGDVLGGLSSRAASAALWQKLNVHGRIMVQAASRREWSREVSADCLDPAEMLAGDLAQVAGETVWTQHGAFGTPDSELAETMPKSTERAVWGPGAVAETLVTALGALVGVEKTAALLRSSQAELRGVAARALGESGEQEGAAFLRTAFAQEQAPEARQALAQALAKLGDRSALEALSKETPVVPAATPTSSGQTAPALSGKPLPAEPPPAPDTSVKEPVATSPPRRESPPAPSQPGPVQGDYTGIYSGSELGDVALRVAADGRVVAIVQSPSVGRSTASGRVQADGRISATAQGGFFKITFEGGFQRQDGTAIGSGTWRSSSGFRGEWRVERGRVDAEYARYLNQLLPMAAEEEPPAAPKPLPQPEAGLAGRGRTSQPTEPASAVPPAPVAPSAAPPTQGDGVQAEGIDPTTGRQVTHGAEDELNPCYDPEGNLTFSTGGRAVSRGSLDMGEGKYFAWLSPAQAGRGQAVDASLENEQGYSRAAWVRWAASGDKVEVAEEWGQQISFAGGGSSLRTTVTRRIVLTRSGNPTVITDNASAQAAPSLSPDGSVVLYSFDRDASGSAGTRLMRVDVEGLEPRVLTQDESSDGLACFAPDGKSIYFVSNRGSGSDLSVMDADGANARPVTKGAMIFAGIAVSPDGSHLAFSSLKGIEGPTAGSGDLWLVRTDGTDLTRLTTDGKNQWPAFRRDGARIAYQSARSGNWDIWVLDPAAAARRVAELTPPPPAPAPVAAPPEVSQN